MTTVGKGNFGRDSLYFSGSGGYTALNICQNV